MRPKSLEDLVEAGKRIDVKVTISAQNGKPVVNIRDFQFEDIRLAQLFIQHIALTEIPGNLEGMIG